LWQKSYFDTLLSQNVSILEMSITEALNQNNGNIRATQKLSRHSDPRTVIIYDDNRVDLQGALTRQLDDLI
jgi:integrase/recombinase XerC